MFQRRYKGLRHSNPIGPVISRMAGDLLARKVLKRNVNMPTTYEHPNEYMIFALPAQSVGQSLLTCPRCNRQVNMLFCLAHTMDESRFKFNAEQDVSCARDMIEMIAKNDWVILVPPRVAATGPLKVPAAAKKGKG